MVLVNSISGQPTMAGDKDAILEPFRPGTGPNQAHYNSQQIAAGSPSGYPSSQEAAEAVDGATPYNAYAASPNMPNPYAASPNPYMPTPGGQIPVGATAPSPAAGSPMFPVNARIPAGTVVPPPPRIMSGTGGLY
jgi:hypothetical protein